MENQTKSDWIRNHIIVCGVPEYREKIENAISEHLSNQNQKKKEA